MTAVIQLGMIGEGGDGVTYLMQRGKFRWVRKLYSTWGEEDSTTEAPLDPFVIELQAYRRIGACSNLDGWIPKCYGCGDRRLELELIDGCQFDQMAPQLTIDALQQMHIILKEVVLRLHDIGVAHGDINCYNIMIDRKVDPPEPILIDFSRATFPHTTFRHSVFDWESVKRQDLGKLAGVFDAAIGDKHRDEAMRILKLRSLGHQHPVRELADHLEHSGIWNDKLLAMLNTIDVREPVYIVAMTRNLIKHRRWEALKVIKQHLPRITDYQAENPAAVDQRSTTMMHAYKAELSGEGFCIHYLPAAIELCKDRLGCMDDFTVSMRLKLAQRNINNACGRQLLETLLRELEDFESDDGMDAERQHLYYEPLRKEHFIETIHKSLELADRFAKFEQNREADGTPSETERCTSSCTHHVDFPAGADTAFAKQSTDGADIASRSIMSLAVRDTPDEES